MSIPIDVTKIDRRVSTLPIAAAGGGAAEPAVITRTSGLMLHLRADDGFNEATGAWADQDAQQANSMGATAGGLATLTTDWQGGRNAVTYPTGVNHARYMNGRGSYWFSASGSGQMIAVVSFNVNNSSIRFTSLGAYGSFRVRYSSGQIEIYSDGTNNAFDYFGSGLISLGTPFILGIYYKGSLNPDLRWRINDSTGTVDVGNNHQGSTYLDINYLGTGLSLGEFATWTTTATEAEFDTDYEAIATSWGLAS
jgi:hypothetical protein